MLFPQLQAYNPGSSALSQLLKRLEPILSEYLERKLPSTPYLKTEQQIIAAARKDQINSISPAYVAMKLGVNESVAIALLHICAKVGILSPRYDIYCPDTEEYIATFYSPEELPEYISCYNHADVEKHLTQDCPTDFMFVFSEKILRSRLLASA